MIGQRRIGMFLSLISLRLKSSLMTKVYDGEASADELASFDRMAKSDPELTSELKRLEDLSSSLRSWSKIQADRYAQNPNQLWTKIEPELRAIQREKYTNSLASLRSENATSASKIFKIASLSFVGGAASLFVILNLATTYSIDGSSSAASNRAVANQTVASRSFVFDPARLESANRQNAERQNSEFFVGNDHAHDFGPEIDWNEQVGTKNKYDLSLVNRSDNLSCKLVCN
jgi:hypothetical protein